jgi:hypothetical protein
LAAAAFQAARRQRVHRILVDVTPNPIELGLGSYQVIVAFLLPKGLAMGAEQLAR